MDILVALTSGQHSYELRNILSRRKCWVKLSGGNIFWALHWTTAEFSTVNGVEKVLHVQLTGFPGLRIEYISSAMGTSLRVLDLDGSKIKFDIFIINTICVAITISPA